MARTKHPLTFRVERRSDHGSRRVVVRIASGEPQAVADTLAGTVDNRAGYGTDDAARSIGRYMATLQRAGVERYYETTWAAESLTIDWLVYEPQGPRDADAPEQYCEPHCDFGDRLEDAEHSIALCKRIARACERLKSKRAGRDYTRNAGRWSLDDAQIVIEALRSMRGAVECESVRLGVNRWEGCYTVAKPDAARLAEERDRAAIDADRKVG